MITGNKGKLDEFIDLLAMDSIEMTHQKLDLPEIQSMNLDEIGRVKTESALTFTDEIQSFDAVLTDDTALSCKGLKGLPGPFIKWFLESVGADGILEAIEKKEKTTTASCVLSMGIIASGEIIQFRGDVKGELVEPKGEGGFGWDRIFQPDSHPITYGEMDRDLKNTLSHRAIAVQELKKWLEQNA